MSGPNIGKVDQNKLRENVYHALRDAFTRGEFSPGHVVNLRGLASDLGTSMTPVREAVRRLVAEGALIDTSSRTLMVPEFDIQRVNDLKHARLALELLVVELAMKNMDNQTIEALEDIINQPRETEGGIPNLTQNYNFHFTLYRKSNSQVLLPLIEALWLQYGAYLNIIVNLPAAQELVEHQFHDEVISALKSGNCKAAQASLEKDIESSFQLLLNLPESKQNSL